MKKWKSLRNVALTSQHKCRCSSEEDGDVIKRRYDVWWLAYSTLYIYTDYYILCMLTKNHVCVLHSKLVTGCASKLLVCVNSESVYYKNKSRSSTSLFQTTKLWLCKRKFSSILNRSFDSLSTCIFMCIECIFPCNVWNDFVLQTNSNDFEINIHFNNM